MSRWIHELFILVLLAVLCSSSLVIAAEDSVTDGSCNSNLVVPDPRREGSLLFYHFESITSTQDQAKHILESSPPDEIATVVVTTTEQTNGRGTNGRLWMGAPGNTFVTICIRQSAWEETGLAMTLLPLKVGTVMAHRIDKLLKTANSEARTTIKWPNDVLVDEKKIAGVLIESTSDWFLIGVGVNVAFAPQVPTEGPNRGRTATSISDYLVLEETMCVAMAQTLAHDMAKDLSHWMAAQPGQRRTGGKVLLQNFKRWIDWETTLVLRDGDDTTPVIPIGIQDDGRLTVRDSKGNKRDVVSDYFL